MLNQLKNFFFLIINKRINKTSKLYDDLKETETLKFLIEKDRPKYIYMLDKGDNKLMRFLKRNCLFYNYPYDYWKHFAKAFYDRCLNPIYSDIKKKLLLYIL